MINLKIILVAEISLKKISIIFLKNHYINLKMHCNFFELYLVEFSYAINLLNINR